MRGEASDQEPGEDVQAAELGAVTTVIRVADDGTPCSAGFIPFAYYEAAANILTDPALDPSDRIPEFEYGAVRVSYGGELAPIASYGGGQPLSDM